MTPSKWPHPRRHVVSVATTRRQRHEPKSQDTRSPRLRTPESKLCKPWNSKGFVVGNHLGHWNHCRGWVISWGPVIYKWPQRKEVDLNRNVTFQATSITYHPSSNHPPNGMWDKRQYPETMGCQSSTSAPPDYGQNQKKRRMGGHGTGREGTT